MSSVPYSSFKGDVKTICQKGNAVEFIQPWYTPISTTPDNTGMAVGGIGNSFTLTPMGNTPSINYIPGIYIDNNHDEFHLNDFYCSVASSLSLDNLVIDDLTKLQAFYRFYPALFSGKLLDFSDSDETNVLSQIKQAVEQGDFYQQNLENFDRWRIELSQKTQQLLRNAPNSVDTQLHVVVDFFNGHVRNATAVSQSLTAKPMANGFDHVDPSAVTYQALYPTASYQYGNQQGVRLERKVVSPIVKGDKALCSLPLHWNNFELTNTSDTAKVVTLVQPLKNLIGATYTKMRPSVQDSACYLTQNPIAQQHSLFELGGEASFVGVSQTSDSPYASDIEGEVLYGVSFDSDSQGIYASVKPTLYSCFEAPAIEAALATGRINAEFDHGIYTQREALSSMVAVQIELAAGESKSVRFIQIMDHSKIALKEWQSSKAYTQFYPQAQPAAAILRDVLPNLTQIETAITAQQQSFLEQAKSDMKDDKGATEFATMAMNTLSFLAEATVWDVEDKFLVKECVDYPFFNSLDVYFYGSYALLYLLPELDGKVMQHFAQAILAEDATQRRFWEYEDKPYAELEDAKYQGIRAIKGAVIHDLGSPFDIQPDAYSWHNVKEWKDLAPKYILMVYRHYQLTGDKSVVEQCWTAVEHSLNYLFDLIAPGDPLPLTRGTDDTFDNLSSHGISIYCASLWAAGLRTASLLAELLGKSELVTPYAQQSANVVAQIEASLWDEEQGYFHFFATPIQLKHLTGEGLAPLAALDIDVEQELLEVLKQLNHYLDTYDPNAQTGRLAQRQAKKQQLLSMAPEAFNDQYQHILTLDSDNSFGDALLADTYLKLIGQEGLFSDDKIQRSLDYVCEQNFAVNSPLLGVANMTLADGAPHEAFQAQDVWIGVQFSVATALRLAGKQEQASHLLATVYHALYQLAKIPFAAPEGFNCSVSVDAKAIGELCECDGEQVVEALMQANVLLADGRVNPRLTSELSQFSALLPADISEHKHGELHQYLQNTGLKYTAGRYFRPGMIFAYLPQALA
nr:GH116 family glycosyl hydrolase [Vibrio sp. SCSIO 43136]